MVVCNMLKLPRLLQAEPFALCDQATISSCPQSSLRIDKFYMYLEVFGGRRWHLGNDIALESLCKAHNMMGLT